MRKLSLFVNTPVPASLEPGIKALAQSENFSVHALKVDEDLFPLLLEAKPCVLLASIDGDEANASLYQLMKAFKEYRVAQGAAARDPALRIVVVAEGQLPRLNWAHLGIYELMVGPVLPNVLAYKLSRHYQKAVVAAEQEIENPVASQEEVSLKLAETTPEWRVFKTSAPETEDEKRELRGEEGSEETVSLRVKLPQLDEKNGQWVSHEDPVTQEEHWEWENKVQPGSEKLHWKWAFYGDEAPVFHPEEKQWEFTGETPKLMRRAPESAEAEAVIEYVRPRLKQQFPHLRARPEVEVASAKTQKLPRAKVTFEAAQKKSRERIAAQQKFAPLRNSGDEPVTSGQGKAKGAQSGTPETSASENKKNRDSSQTASAANANTRLKPESETKAIPGAASVLASGRTERAGQGAHASQSASNLKSENLQNENQTSGSSKNIRTSEGSASNTAASQSASSGSSGSRSGDISTSSGGFSSAETAEEAQKIDELLNAHSADRKKHTQGRSESKSEDAKRAATGLSSQDQSATPRGSSGKEDAGQRSAGYLSEGSQSAALSAEDRELKTNEPGASGARTSAGNQMSSSAGKVNVGRNEAAESIADFKSRESSAETSGRSDFKIKDSPSDQSLSVLFDDEASSSAQKKKQAKKGEAALDPAEWKFELVKKVPALKQKVLAPEKRLAPSQTQNLSVEEKRNLFDRILQYILSLFK